MKSDLIRVSTLGMTRDKWLEARRSAIGGSDAAAIIGLNQYSSPYSVWADKTGRLPEKPDNEAMRQGRDLEEYVASRWREETGKKTHRVNAILYNKDIPFAHANVDRWVTGENAGLECKTTSIMNLKNMPYMYPECNEPLKSLGYRKIIVKNYIMIYEVNEKKNNVNLLRLFYAKSDYVRFFY